MQIWLLTWCSLGVTVYPVRDSLDEVAAAISTRRSATTLEMQFGLRRTFWRRLVAIGKPLSRILGNG